MEQGKTKLQEVVLSAAVIDSDQSAKIILQLKYEEDMGVVEEIPIIIDNYFRGAIPTIAIFDGKNGRIIMDGSWGGLWDGIQR